jgi:hypothetical protein
MQATPRQLLGVFEQTLRYVVPIFQRHYVWGPDEQWQPLWEDILEKHAAREAGRKPPSHFLGAVILDSVKKTSTRETTRFVVIDGQQRITTVQLMLAALRDYATASGSQRVGTAVGRHLFNPDPELMEKPEEERFKLWPTQFNRKVFCDVVLAGSRERVDELYPLRKLKYKRKPEPRDRLVDAYVFFYSQIAALYSAAAERPIEDRLLDLYGVLRDDFSVVEIILGEQDDSQEIFNSLNAHGKPLAQSDLLRSFIFMRAEKSSEDRDALFEKYWSMFEDDFWDMAVRRGNLWSTRLDHLTRVFLSVKTGAPIDARKVHLTYKQWIEHEAPYPSVEAELQQFALYGKRYRYLAEPPGDDSTSAFARRLQIWDVSTAIPLALYLFEEAALAPAAIEACLSTLESYLVRRLICRKDNKEYNKYFVELVGELRRRGPSPEALLNLLSLGAGVTREWPGDEEFASCWCHSEMYNVVQNSQLVTILKLLDDGLRTNKSERVSVLSASVEHVMPQDWAENYPLNGQMIPKAMSGQRYLPSDDATRQLWESIRSSVQARNRSIHCLGNLTLVTQPLNSSMRNAPFSQKKDALRNSVLLLNRYFDDLDHWDEAAIDTRANSLLSRAIRLWRGPIPRAYA